MESTDNKLYDVAIVGGGLAGIIALVYARRAGLQAIVLERQDRVGGLWRDLPPWQDIQISAVDWTLGDLPIEGTTQPHILANIEAWVDHFVLADDIRLNTPVQSARHSGSAWELQTLQGVVTSRHLIAATGAHNTPRIPEIARTASTVTEYHSSALHDPTELAGRDVLVVGGGASAYDLLDLCFEHRARHVAWAYRGLRWFAPTNKPKDVAGSVRPFARMQASGMTMAQQSSAIDASLRSLYEDFGIETIMPAGTFDLENDQLIPGRSAMLANFEAIERHHATVESIAGRAVTLSDGQQIESDLLLWGTGYSVDLSYFDSPEIRSIRSLGALAARCGGLFRSLDAPDLYFPGIGLDGIGSAPWLYSLLSRSIVSHISGTARLDLEVVAHRLNHFDVVDYLGPRDPESYPPVTWRKQYRDLALDSLDAQPYNIP